MSYSSRFFATLLFVMLPGSLLAQAHHGLTSEGRDFYIGYMPNLPIPNPPNGPGSITYENPYIFICSASDNNRYTVNYFDDAGNEIAGSSRALMRGQCIEIPIVQTSMTPSRPGEKLEFKAAHITSTYPVSVAVYQEGSAGGGMYQAIPTAALGKSYVVGAFFDCPKNAVPCPDGFADTSRSEFMIVATQDSTHVTWTPASTTVAGVTGMNVNGNASRPSLTMRRGQVYWVRSNGADASNDLTGSTIVSDKPVAVLGGQEKALLGNPAGLVSQWADVRNLMVQQMTPIDSWDSEYISMPFLPAQYTDATGEGYGDLLRIVTDSANAGTIDAFDQSNSGLPSRFISAFQNPPANYDNIIEPLDFRVEADASTGKRKKMYVQQYDYFQGNGSTDVRAYTAPDEMNLVGFSKMARSTVFHIRANSKYNGAQYINIITRRDSLVAGNILIMINGLPTIGTPLSQLPRMQTYSIPNHPDLIGFTSHVGPGDYMIWGNTPLVCYSYGRTENSIKLSPWAYAAPTGQLYGSGAGGPARAIITPQCDHWDIRAYENRPNDQGIAEVMLLNDPNGVYESPGRVSYNSTIVQPKFTPGDTSVSFEILINDARKDAYAALYIIDRGGRDTVIDLYYTAPKVDMVFGGQTFDTSVAVPFKNASVGGSVCATVKAIVRGTGNISSADFSTLSLFHPDQRDSIHPFSVTTHPTIPATLHNGDTITFSICFNAPDTNKHYDALAFNIGCVRDTININGNGVTAIIIADDHDFQSVPVGMTKCAAVLVRNVGNGNLILTRDWVLHLNPDFSFEDSLMLPDTIKPESAAKFVFCFTPSHAGPSSTRFDWATNIGGEFAHQRKDTSFLTGYGIETKVQWDRRVALFGTWDAQTQRIYLVNNGMADASITNIYIEGPATAEFHIIGNQLGYPLPSPPFSLAKSDSIWFDIAFTPDSSRNFIRHASLAANSISTDGQTHGDTLVLIGQLGFVAGVTMATSVSSELKITPDYSNRNLIEISLPSEFRGVSDLVVLDALGRTVKELRSASGSLQLDVSTLPNGTYYLRVTNGVITQSTKFAIVH